MDFTLKNVVELGGPDFVYNQSPANGNVKLDIKALAEKTGQSLTDDQKVDLLVAARQKFIEAGFNANIRLSSRRQDGSWANWPHMWVNKPTESTASGEVKEELASLRAQLNSLMSMLGEKASTITETSTEEPPTPEVEF